MLTPIQFADMQEVWMQVMVKHPEFTQAHDPSGNYHSVREIVLGGSTGWAGVHRRFTPAPGMRVMDVGANAGIWSAFCAVKGAYVVAYEPFAAPYLLLTMMIEKTKLEKRITALNAAVWHKDGWLPYIGNITSLDGACTVFNGGLETAGVPWTRSDIVNAKKVACVSFDEAIGSFEWDCVKMDVEGAEAEIIVYSKPETLNRIRFMYIEFHPWIPQDLYDSMIRKLQDFFTFEGLYVNDQGRWEAAYLTR